MKLRDCLSVTPTAWEVTQEASEENTQKTEALASLYSQLRHTLGVDFAHIEEQLVCIRNSVTEGNSAKEELQNALLEIRNLKEAEKVQIHEYATKQKEYEQLQESLREYKNQRDSLSLCLSASLQSHKTLTDIYSVLLSEKNALDKMLSEQNKALVRYEEVEVELKRQSETCEKEKFRLNETNESLKREIIEILESRRVSVAEKEEQIKQQKEENQAINRSLEFKLDDLNLQIAALTGQSQILELENERLQADLRNAQSDYFNLHRTFEITSSERSSLEKQLSELQSKNNSLRENLNRQVCVVCMEGLNTIILQPCNHLCLCKSCAKLKIANCPICSTRIEGKIKVFIA